ncbi:MAG: nucleotidyltransferase domain-containing protein [Acidobacteriia bacterium]|nr:nucleotidyltransferase domain-containing protein [Terriglobia bacterium]
MATIATDQTLRTQRAEILRIALLHGIGNIRVFGSFARGESVPDSDLDLLVDLEAGRSLLDIIGAKQDLEDLLERRVDIVTERSLSPYVREGILKEAVCL